MTFERVISQAPRRQDQWPELRSCDGHSVCSRRCPRGENDTRRGWSIAPVRSVRPWFKECPSASLGFSFMATLSGQEGKGGNWDSGESGCKHPRLSPGPQSKSQGASHAHSSFSSVQGFPHNLHWGVSCFPHCGWWAKGASEQSVSSQEASLSQSSQQRWVSVQRALQTCWVSPAHRRFRRRFQFQVIVGLWVGLESWPPTSLVSRPQVTSSQDTHMHPSSSKSCPCGQQAVWC